MNILSFDLEDWFHILGNRINNAPESWGDQDTNFIVSVEKILELLYTHKQKATFFCLGWIAGKYPQLVRKIQAQGYEIGSHTHTHRRISEYSKGGFQKDVERSIKTIEDITGAKVTSFRFPGFQINTDYLWALETLVSLGIQSDSSVQVSYRHVRNIEKTYPAVISSGGLTIREFPIPVWSLLGYVLYRSGSGYFRLYPYDFTKNFLQDNHYNMIYFHPRDVLAPPHSEHYLNPVRKFKNNKGMKKVTGKLDCLLSNFVFTDIRTAAGHVNWKESRLFRYG